MSHAPPSSDLDGHEKRRRSPIVAGLLALCARGLGHLYCDRARQAVLLAAVSLTLSVGFLALIALPPVPFEVGFPLGLVVLYGFWLAQAVWAAAVARRTMVETFRVPEVGMVPRFLPGDNFLVSKLDPSRIRYGDVVAFNLGDRQIVRRVVAMAGDTIASRRSGSAKPLRDGASSALGRLSTNAPVF